ncbi:hypothetical protein P170DRAFT_511527 [Aspergillus steynii IBT 23096]|uniref:Uncharacterized protein n=1 Tax=Aspergillus steynii IBT 23096 TaxID=1392250 RepID=A0A2I2G1V4_9EURO|nr:uncharacterized protein P170DRAFT_511527 [Aspergillus steynii IBT 23096]PLB46853.1 hypothetical protein P170DRAFT_511527 [Aspergillus steynii IBT 23096]
MASMLRIDRRSGQAYVEREMKPLNPNGPSWVHETPYLPEGWESTSTVGAPTLKHAAMRQTLSNQRRLVPELFANVPWQIASYLWDCLGRSRKRTLYIWKVFATAYPQQFSLVAQYRSMKIGGLKLPLRDYLAMMKSDDMHWRVTLTLRVSCPSVPELVEISDVRNLVALDVITPAGAGLVSDDPETPDLQVTALNDRIVRTWSELAQTTGAFAHLRILRLFYQDDLSKVVLRYLARIPALQFIVVYECDGLTRAMRRGMDGWEAYSSDSIRLIELFESYQNSLSCGDDHEPMDRDRPILDFHLGTMMDPLPLRSARNRSKVLCLRRTNAEAEPASKRLKVTRSLDTFQKPSKRRKPVMKDRRTKDLGEALGDFL